MDEVSQNFQEEFFANFNSSRVIDISDLSVLEDIKDSLEEFQNKAKGNPVASLTAVEGIGERLLSSVDCPPDKVFFISKEFFCPPDHFFS